WSAALALGRRPSREARAGPTRRAAAQAEAAASPVMPPCLPPFATMWNLSGSSWADERGREPLPPPKAGEFPRREPSPGRPRAKRTVQRTEDRTEDRTEEMLDRRPGRR